MSAPKPRPYIDAELRSHDDCEARWQIILQKNGELRETRADWAPHEAEMHTEGVSIIVYAEPPYEKSTNEIDLTGDEWRYIEGEADTEAFYRSLLGIYPNEKGPHKLWERMLAFARDEELEDIEEEEDTSDGEWIDCQDAVIATTYSGARHLRDLCDAVSTYLQSPSLLGRINLEKAAMKAREQADTLWSDAEAGECYMNSLSLQGERVW